LLPSLQRAAGSARNERLREELARDFNLDVSLIPAAPVYPDAAALMRATGPTTLTVPPPPPSPGGAAADDGTADATTAAPPAAANSVPLLPVDFLAPVPAAAVLGDPRGGDGGGSLWPPRSAATVPGVATVVDDLPSAAGGVGGADALDVERLTRYAQLRIHRSQAMPSDRRGRPATCETARIQYTPLSDIGLGGAIRVAASVLGHAMLAGRLLVFKPNWHRWSRKGTICAGLGWDCFFLPPSACSSAEVTAFVKPFTETSGTKIVVRSANAAAALMAEIPYQRLGKKGRFFAGGAAFAGFGRLCFFTAASTSAAAHADGGRKKHSQPSPAQIVPLRPPQRPHPGSNTSRRPASIACPRMLAAKRIAPPSPMSDSGVYWIRAVSHVACRCNGGLRLLLFVRALVTGSC